MIQAIRIPVEGKPEMVELPDGDIERLTALQELVGGNIEGLEFGVDDATAFGNEEAKFSSFEIECRDCDGSGKDPSDDDTCPTCNGRGVVGEVGAENEFATKLIVGDKEKARENQEKALAKYRESGFEVIDATTGDPREPYIAGPVVVTGIDRRSGETTDVPQKVAFLMPILYAKEEQR